VNRLRQHGARWPTVLRFMWRAKRTV